MMRKIAIQHREGSFSDYWVPYAEQNGVPYKLVDIYSSSIVADLADCVGLMWHWNHDSYADQLFARQLTLALEAAGKKVFPSVATAWHFDDKVGQKYLLEALALPLVPSHVFYTKAAALDWLDRAAFPLVFKLRGGAGSMNVRLLKSRADAGRVVGKAFGKGFPAVDLDNAARQTAWEFARDRTAVKLARALVYRVRAVLNISPKSARLRPPQVGYAYFQEFIPDNAFDHRLIVIGDRCFCIERGVRPRDFRASGSGLLSYDQQKFPLRTVELAFRTAQAIKSQSVAIDFVYRGGEPLIVEVSYAFAHRPYENCPGYFDARLQWHPGKVLPANFIFDDFLASCDVG